MTGADDQGGPGAAAELEAAFRYDPSDYPLTDAHLAAEAEIDDAVAEADHSPGATLATTVEPVPYELTELGAGQAVADQMTEREVGPGYLADLAADREAGS